MRKKKSVNKNTEVAELVTMIMYACDKEKYETDVVLKALTSGINIVLAECCDGLANIYKALDVLLETAKTDAASFDAYRQNKNKTN